MRVRRTSEESEHAGGDGDGPLQPFGKVYRISRVILFKRNLTIT